MNEELSTDLATDSDHAAAVQMSESRYSRLSETDRFMIAKMHADGRNQTEIAAVVRCSQSTISDFLRRAAIPSEMVRAVARSYAPDAIEDLVKSSSVAAKRGDCTPAMKILGLGNAELGAEQGKNSGLGGITVNIGVPGSPIALPDMPIIDLSPQPNVAIGLSPVHQIAVSDDALEAKATPNRGVSPDRVA